MSQAEEEGFGEESSACSAVFFWRGSGFYVFIADCQRELNVCNILCRIPSLNITIKLSFFPKLFKLLPDNQKCLSSIKYLSCKIPLSILRTSILIPSTRIFSKSRLNLSSLAICEVNILIDNLASEKCLCTTSSVFSST